MLSSQNLAFNAQAAAEMTAPVADELLLNILPFSHAYARTSDIYYWLARRSRLALARSRADFIADARTTQPTAIHGVPQLFTLLLSALATARQAKPHLTLPQLLGGRLLACSSGGAPLPATIRAAALEAGLPVLEGYGLTEAAPIVTLSTRQAQKPGSCGRALPGTELSCSATGEVLVRGPHVMLGYYRDPQATQEVIREGWLHTGDLGTLDADGYLTLHGRQKELLALATGRKITPRVVEDRFARDPWASASCCCAAAIFC
jgi:long-chain acyl-CoA synthetase